ncbi:MAG: DMT family transporter [Methanomassiliicoccales archaeon]|jgi:drug/metabolite transporter (DMT)-like permease
MVNVQKGSPAPYIGVAVAVFSVSFASIFIRWSDVPPVVIAAYRMLFAALMLLPFAIVHREAQFKYLDRSTFSWLLVIGLVLALHFATWITSLGMTSVASSTLLVTAHPLLVGVVSILFFKESGKWTALGVTIGFAGVVFISLLSQGDGSWDGNFMALLGGVFAGIYILSGRRMRKKVNLIAYAFIIYLSAAAFLFLAAIVLDQPIWPYPMQEFILFLLLAGVSTILGHTVYNWSLKYVTAPLVSASLLGEPILASVLALFILGEIPSYYIIPGGALILIGVLFVLYDELSNKKNVGSA